MSEASEQPSSEEDLGKKLTQAYIEFDRALQAESDRGCALYAAAYIDVELMELLSASLVQHKDITQDLFKGTQQLSTFSSRISMAYYLGLISPEFRADLDILRRIRNDFAHSNQAVTFSTEAVANRCSRLATSFREQDASPRAKFTAAASTILAVIARLRVNAKPIPEKPREFFTGDQRAAHLDKVRAHAEKIAAAAGIDLSALEAKQSK
ncbi:hypothetical protein KAF81_33040 [Pseudomonas aeruginosa]|uniref:hypothetical protein n=1 Tax=Pseudomonas aeruginosa TaxID=287 RepID=UPI001B36AA0F|nr:hypothetical protein [Pseudomonas aeruginosa]MBP8322471.1 hypothetical protein [Pseudomonas aeruginosa]